MKVAFVIGHHEKDKGAYSPYLKVSEWDFYKEVISYIPEASVFYHDSSISSYTERIKNTASKINKVDFDLVIELHFNAASESANGCETLYYYNSKKGAKYAKAFSRTVNDRTGIKLRNNGLKPLVNSKDRGFASVYYTTAPTILIEPFFGSNEEDVERIVSAKNVSIIINEFLDHVGTRPRKPPRT